jgi:hypothetical protein
MEHSKLFHVLVVGGALLGAGCETAPPVADASGASDAPRPDGEALVECGFCPNDCCVPDGAGGSQARDGFVCCWGTSC